MRIKSFLIGAILGLGSACTDAASQAADAGPDAAPSDLAMLAPPDFGRDYGSDRSTFFGPSRCAQAGLQLCEDFESGTLDTATWTTVGTKPTIDGAQHARGAKALHVMITGNGSSYIKETKTFPAPSNSYWGRMFVYFQALPGTPLTYSHWTIMAAAGTGVSGEIRLSGQLQSGANHFGVGTDNRVDAMGTGDWTTSDNDPAGNPAAVPTGQWLCLEWLHKGDTNETRFFWDGVEHPSLHTTSSMHGGNNYPFILPQFTSVWMGWQEYQTTTEPFEMWVDEIGIDKDRIGCVL